MNDSGTVSFQAALRDGTTGVFTGSGEAITDVVSPGEEASITSHPDLNNAGATCFYAEVVGGRQAVFRNRDGRLSVLADTDGPFVLIGPLGPTMNEAGAVAFRADRAPGTSGVFAADGDDVVTIADTDERWESFHGLPVITSRRDVVFRADSKDGIQGIYSARDGSIEPVAESGEFFESLAPFPSADHRGRVAFAATLRKGGAGVFVADEGRVTQVIGTNGAFESCRGGLIAGTGAVVAIAAPRGGSLGLFAGPDPEADKILAIGDPLLGSTVEDLASNPVSVNAVGQVAIRVALADETQLIVRADPVA